MNHLKILVIGNELAENDWIILKEGLQFVARKVAPNAPDFVEYEDLSTFSQSRQLVNHASNFGYCIIIGKSAYDKTKSQIENSGLHYISIISPNRWKDKEIRKTALTEIADLMKKWADYWIEKKILVKADQTKQQTAEETAEWIESNLTDFEKMMELMISNHRYQAGIFKIVDEPNPFIEVVDATKKQRVPIKEVTPILVLEEVKEDEEKLEKALKSVRTSGFENPYPVTIREFMLMIRIICQLARSGRARIEINGTTGSK